MQYIGYCQIEQQICMKKKQNVTIFRGVNGGFALSSDVEFNNNSTIDTFLNDDSINESSTGMCDR